jgi:formylglycine-generating enzyme required for sulfatase activity
MVMIFIPAGEFIMGSSEADAEADDDEKPQHRVYLEAYWIDQTEVTNAMYTGCVAAGVCRPIVTPRPDMADWPNYPAQGVIWSQAQAYCQWVGRRLPTEAEWEKAARGTDGRLYPWGEAPSDASRANFDFLVGDVTEVGSYPDGASPYGVLDMAGNVWEWVADWYDEAYYQEAPYENPPGPSFGLTRVIRGGAWNVTGRGLRGATRFWAFPDRNDFDGFRCAADDSPR